MNDLQALISRMNDLQVPEPVATTSETTSETASAQPRLEISGMLPPQDIAAVTMLTEAATEADGVRPLSEHVSLHLRYGGEGPDLHLLAAGSR